MANVTIYLDDELAKRVKAANLPISQICQVALRFRCEISEAWAAEQAARERRQINQNKG